MTNPTSSPDLPTLELFDAYCTNTLDSQSADELTKLLKSSAPNRRHFVEYVDLHNELYDHVRFEELDMRRLLRSLDTSEKDARRLHRRHLMMASLTSCLLCTLLMATVGYWYIQYAYFFGELLAVADGQLTFQNEPMEVNETLGTGRLSLADGAATIEIGGKSRFLMSAGSEVDILSRNALRLNRGNVSIQTGGRKMTVYAGDRILTNLGTDFSVSMANGSPSELHVVDGAIAVNSPENSDKASSSQVSGHKSVSLRGAKGSKVEDLPYNPCAFMSPTQLVETVDSYRSSQIAQQIRELKKNRADGLVLRHSFEDVTLSSKVVLNQAEGKLAFGAGEVVLSQPTPGRYPHSTALHFRGGSQEDRVELSQEDSARLDATKPMTVLMWVRVERFEHRFSRLISRGRGEELSWAIWFRRSDQVLGLGYGPGKDDNLVADVPIQDGKWHQVAFTFRPTGDGTSRICFYFDGKLINQTDNAVTLSTTAPLLIGNCQEDDSWNGFAGDIDEVAIFNRALSEEEIRQDFEH